MGRDPDRAAESGRGSPAGRDGPALWFTLTDGRVGGGTGIWSGPKIT
jgi:hypothetical protein